MTEQYGIATRYLGIDFRSLLEAKWAAFFTLVGWKWTYEPFELAGYIPDFLVELPRHDWIAAPGRIGVPLDAQRIIEVKPVVDPLMLTEHAPKIHASGWEGDVSIVGATLWDNPDGGTELGVQRVPGEPIGWGAWLMVPRTRALLAWREASNQVQWKPRGAAR